MINKIFNKIKQLLFDTYKKIQRHYEILRQKREFRSSIIEMAKNGFFTKENMAQIDNRCKELNMTLADLKNIRVDVFETAMLAIEGRGDVTKNEEKDLEKIQNFLMIPDNEIEPSKVSLKRLLLLTEIKNGNIPTVLVPNIILQKNENAYWRESGKLLEERVVGRRYEGGSQGVSVRIAKGLSYRVGSQRGRLITDTKVLPISGGDLVITNKRVIFMGAMKSFEIKLDKVLGVNFLDDGIAFTSGTRAKPFVVQFYQPSNSEIVKAIYTHLINQFKN